MEDKTAVATEVNRLYWRTDSSVAEISNRLGVSRRALYEAIEPMASGVECSQCGGELYYANRSAKAAGVARCLVCGNEKDLSGAAAADERDLIPSYASSGAYDNRQRTAILAGLAIAGVVVGSIATLLVRRKR